MRVLYVTSGFVYPLTAGQLRHYYLLRGLGQRHAVTLVSLVDPGFDLEHLRAVGSLIERVIAFGADDQRSPTSRARRKVGAVAPALAGGGVRAMQQELRDLAATGEFDVVVVAGRRAAPLVRRLGLPLVVDLCDAAGARILAGLPHRGVRAPSDALDYLQARGVERWSSRRADRVLFASERDRELVVGDQNSRAVVVPNGVDLGAWTRTTPVLGDGVVFFGNLGYPPNDDAALQLVDHILPLVRREHAHVRVDIVGTGPSRRLVEAGRRAGVNVTGYVDDVAPFLERAAVMAAPLRTAAGIQNKVLQAMAMEVPVVTTTVGAAGLYIGSERPPITIADGVPRFAALLAARLSTVGADATPDRAARQYVLEHFDWRRSVDAVDAALADAVAHHRQRSSA